MSGFMGSSDDEEKEVESDDEPFSEEDKKPAGGRVEKVHVPASIREIYSFLELLHDSGVGRRVYLCEYREREGLVASRGPAASSAEGEAGEQKRVRCIVKAWAKSARPPEETRAWLQTQLLLLRMERHPNVMQPRRILEDERCYYVELDAVLVGCSLLQVILNDASITEQQLRRITREILRGLGHLHSHGLSHGDVKPENILLEWQRADGLLNKHAKLPNAWPSTKRGVSQWGAAAHFKSAWCRHDLVSRVRIIDLDTVGAGDSRRVCGTPGYMAPEAYTGAAAGPRGDLFGAGVILYLLIRCAAPLHDAVFGVLGDAPLEEASEATRERIVAAVRKCLKGINWDKTPFDKLDLAAKLCKTLLCAEPADRGNDASSALEHEWFAPGALALGADELADVGDIMERLDDFHGMMEDYAAPDRRQMRQNVVIGGARRGSLGAGLQARRASIASAVSGRRRSVVGPAGGIDATGGRSIVGATSRRGSVAEVASRRGSVVEATSRRASLQISIESWES